MLRRVIALALFVAVAAPQPGVRAQSDGSTILSPPAAPAQQRGPRPGAGPNPTPAAQPAPAAPMMRQETEASASQLLDNSLVANPERIAQARAKAQEAPPQSNDPQVLAEFFRLRAIEAQTAGLQSQALKDVEQAVRHGERASNFDMGELYNVLAHMQVNMGRRVTAYRTMEKAIAATPATRRPRLVIYYGFMSSQAAGAGHLEVAERALREAEVLVRDLGGGRGVPPQARRNAEISLIGARGTLSQAKGQYESAETDLRRVIAELEAAEGRQNQAIALRRRMMLSRILVQQGRLAEAENEARTALVGVQKLFGTTGMLPATMLANLAAVLTEQGRLAEAEGLARKSLEIVQAAGLAGYGQIRANLANVLALQGRWNEARQEFEVIRRGLSQSPDELEALNRGNLALPLVMIKTGRAAEAVAMLADQIQRQIAQVGDKHYGTAELRGIYAMALAETGRRDQALAELDQALPILLSRSREADDDSASASARDQRLRLIVETVMKLNVDGRRADATAETFRLAESARGRSVARALAASAGRAAASNPALAELARREQDTQRQVAALNGLLGNAISARGDEQDPAAVKLLRERIDGLRDQRARIVEEIERKFPDYAQIINPKPATIESARKALVVGEALVNFYSADDLTYVWAIPAQGAPAFATWAMGRGALDALIGTPRKALDPNAESLDDIPAFDLAAAHKLYAGLLQPVEAGWRGAKSLLVVPHGPLGQISLALLPTAPAQLAQAKGEPFAAYRQVPWLLRQAAVSQLPSVASLATLRALPAGNANRRAFVGFGDPLFSTAQAAEAATQTAQVVLRGGKIKLRSAPKASGIDVTAELGQLPRLPETADEVKSVALALKGDPARDLFIGAKATKAMVSSANLADYRVVMFATHGLVPGDLTGLGQPALAMTSPAVTPNGGNGLLTMEDILALKLDADWVVLSACNTASGQGAGAEAISGLGRAFFYAGTRALLVSNWPVETSSAQKLTTDLFARQAGNAALTRAEAMRQAMLGLIDGPGPADGAGKPMFSYAHPIFWAAFTLVGDGGR